MYKTKVPIVILSLFVLFYVGGLGYAEAEQSGEAKWAAKAANILETQMTQIPDKRIPESLLKKAKCVAVFPSVLKAGFVVGAKRGEGLISCRNQDTGKWGAPAFFRITGVSWGLQIGAQAADVIFLVMNQKGIDGLLKSKTTLGGEVGVTAGPVGRNASVSTDLLLKSPIISYARSKGVFAGLSLEGSTIKYLKKETTKVYGKEVDARGVLFNEKTTPETVKVFHDTLSKFAPKPEKK